MYSRGYTLAANAHYTRGVHVLLVDSDLAALTAMIRLLEFLSYRVTVTQTGHAALSILQDARNEINLVIVDVRLNDMNGFIILNEAMSRNIVTVLMSSNGDMMVMRMALAGGATLFIHKPMSSFLAKDLWQFVDRAKLYRPPIRIPQQLVVRNLPVEREDSEGDSNTSEVVSLGISERNPMMKRRKERTTTTDWTDELHAKFVDAVIHLGDGNCYPKEILERMNVPDLTRMQVASHLQKCREGRWHGPEDYNPFFHKAQLSKLGKQSGSKKFGAMPLSVKLQLATPPGSRVAGPMLRLGMGFMDAPSSSKASSDAPSSSKATSDAPNSSKDASDAPSTSSSGGSSVEKKFYKIIVKLGKANESLKIRSPKKGPASP